MLEAAPLLQHYPLPMARFGLNPYGEHRYRIVLASSVTQLVGGQWPDGSRGYRWSVPLSYRDKGWILEAWDHCRMSPREWDSMIEPFSGWPVRGPYPSRGEYYLSWEFERGGISASDVERIIGAIEKGRGRSFQDVRQAMMKEYQDEEKNQKRVASDEVRDACTAFGVRAISSLTGVSRGTKTAPELRTAQELGLPIPHAGPRVPRGTSKRRTFDVRDAKVTSTLISGR